MKTIFKLNTNDIRKLIAERYRVDEDDVIVKSERASVGYGAIEHDEYVPIATVTLKD